VSTQVSELPMGWIVRSNTWDRSIYDCVVVENEYDLPDRFEGYDHILDVGCHVGAFSWACLERGAGRVYAYEANPESLALAAHNVCTKYPGGFIPNVGVVWRSDGGGVQELFYHRHPNPMNTGGGDVLHAEGDPVLAIHSFDGAVRRAANQWKRVRLVKLDCEGSEFPILFTSSCLHMIDEIVGEYHLFDDLGDRFADLPPFTGQVLAEYLTDHGFTVSIAPCEADPILGRFRAVR